MSDTVPYHSSQLAPEDEEEYQRAEIDLDDERIILQREKVSPCT